jgi:hypothetical protein
MMLINKDINSKHLKIQNQTERENHLPTLIYFFIAR